MHMETVIHGGFQMWEHECLLLPASH